MSDRHTDISLSTRSLADFALKRLPSSTRVAYSTAIALKLSAQLNLPPILVATQLAKLLTTQAVRLLHELPLPADALSHLQIQTVESGLIQLELTDAAIAAWLTVLVEQPLVVSQTFAAISVSDQALFAVQHAHARCCSLLRLAAQTGAIGLTRLDMPDPNRPPQWRCSQPIGWLTAANQLYLTHPTERELLVYLFAAWDEVLRLTPNSHRVFQLAAAVAQKWTQFWGDRPLWSQPPLPAERAAQFGLVLSTQRILQLLLQECLQLPAPIEL